MKYLKKYLPILLLTCLLPFAISCIRADKVDNSSIGNYNALWKIIDERYCYLDVKGIDWDAVYDKYLPRVQKNLSRDELFDLCSDMLSELKDGHVNLSSPFNLGREWSWYEDYPRNFEESIVEEYLGRDYRIAGGIKYTILNDNIGYIYYSSFANPIGNGNLDNILDYLSLCDGLIVDIRNNGGGNITNSTLLSERFTNVELVTSYIMYKTGKGHSSFSDPYPIKLKPSRGVKWQKPAAVLTNRRVYSAANDFANNMRYMPNVKIIGDRTGGGGGLPFTSELPNGWSVRFSASPMLDAELNHIEFGINPDIKVDMSPQNKIDMVDDIIEAARKYLKKNV